MYIWTLNSCLFRKWCSMATCCPFCLCIIMYLKLISRTCLSDVYCCWSELGNTQCLSSGLKNTMLRSCHDTLIDLMHTVHVLVPVWPPLRVLGLTAFSSRLDLHQQTQPGNSLWKVLYVNGLLMNITSGQSCLDALERTVFSIMYIDFST